MNEQWKEKIVSVATAVVGTLFAVLSVVVAFGALPAEQMDNIVVQALLLALGVLFFGLLALGIVLAFRNPGRVRSMILFKNTQSATKTTIGVIRATARRAARQVPEAQLKSVRLLSDENGNLHLKLDVRVRGEHADEAAMRVELCVRQAFLAVFGVTVPFVDVNLKGVDGRYTVDRRALDAGVKAQKQAAGETPVPTPQTPTCAPLAREPLPAETGADPKPDEAPCGYEEPGTPGGADEGEPHPHPCEKGEAQGAADGPTAGQAGDAAGGSERNEAR